MKKDFEKVMQAILEKHGGLDILINNAGVTGFDEGMGPQDPEHASLESWHEVHRVNLDGVFLGIKHALPLMKGRGASIVNISSRSGMVGVPGAAAYASSKAAVRNHTKSVALYCADKKYKIRCNSIHPAAIHTPMWEPMLGTGKKRQEMIEQIASTCPLNTFGQSEDVAYAALYLACDESKYMTGSEITLDGGILAGSASAPAKSE
jgi:3(or 17)beta-hydroxysteroid dehydrogenase